MKTILTKVVVYTLRDCVRFKKSVRDDVTVSRCYPMLPTISGHNCTVVITGDEKKTCPHNLGASFVIK